MKKFVIYVLFVFTVAISGFYIYKNVQASRYESTAVPYIKQVLPKISTWDPALAREYMAAEVLETVSVEELKNLMGWLSKIGELQSIGDPNFENRSTGGNTDSEQKPVITYSVDARYSTGDATVTISLLDNSGSYEVYHFNFQSLALAQ